jgi:perosamine synthetase
MWSCDRVIRAREAEFRHHFDVRHASLVSSGTAALTLALAALKELSQRTEVVIPAFSCYSVPAAVLKAGLRPVLCDVDASTFDFDHASLGRTLSENTLCVVAHHLFGVPSNIERLRSMCHSRGIFVVEDAAQAMGVHADGGYLGTQGDVGIFSFGRGKNITCGSGGLIVTRRDSIAEALEHRCRSLERPPSLFVVRELIQLIVMAAFIRPSLYWIPAALPFLRLGETIFPANIPVHRLSGMQAGLLRHWRRHLSESNQLRAHNAADLSRRLSLTLPRGESHPYLRLPVLASSRDDKKRIFEASRRQGLGMSVAYPTAIDEVPQLKRYTDGRRFPTATKLAQRLLTLPTHRWVSKADKRAIVRCLSTSSRTDVRPPASSFEAVHHG